MLLNANFGQIIDTCEIFWRYGIIENTLIMKIIALWEICHRTYFPGLPTDKMVTDSPW